MGEYLLFKLGHIVHSIISAVMIRFQSIYVGWIQHNVQNCMQMGILVYCKPLSQDARARDLNPQTHMRDMCVLPCPYYIVLQHISNIN